MRVGIGGTFNIIHVGHELLFETAFSIGDHVQVGLTSDDFARGSRQVPVRAFEERREALGRFLERYGKPYDIVEISDPMGTARTSSDLDAIVVSPETRDEAMRINLVRQENGLDALKIFSIRHVKAEDTRVVSASRIAKGEIDRDGHLLRPLKVAVATDNRVKVEAVRNISTQIFGLVDVVEVPTSPEAPSQPLGDRTIEGSVERARLAMGQTEADFGVGVEAGLFWVEPLKKHLDVQYCTVVDSEGRTTYGHGPGFEYPPVVTKAALSGQPVGEIMSRISGIDKIGHRMGSIGYLSGGVIDRVSLTELSVLMALIPRIRSDLYREDGDIQTASASETASR